ncbi:MAG TPA: cytochrome b5 domain-containing protein [Bacillota bacterium]|jgi:predicted heme/steroid binding protein|nr:cytochrome b5 domain-containing protein [Bacillota bacterium]
MKKSIVLFCMLIFSLFSLSSLSAQSEKKFTPTELAKYDGKNGAKAYVAVNGIVYDVTPLPSWRSGRHFCPGALAGKDITSLWNRVPGSHRNPEFLKGFPVVGRLIASPKTAAPTPNSPRTKRQGQKPQPRPNQKATNHTRPYLWAGAAALVLVAIILIARSRRK